MEQHIPFPLSSKTNPNQKNNSIRLNSISSELNCDCRQIKYFWFHIYNCKLIKESGKWQMCAMHCDWRWINKEERLVFSKEEGEIALLLLFLVGDHGVHSLKMTHAFLFYLLWKSIYCLLLLSSINILWVRLELVLKLNVASPQRQIFTCSHVLPRFQARYTIKALAKGSCEYWISWRATSK